MSSPLNHQPPAATTWIGRVWVILLAVGIAAFVLTLLGWFWAGRSGASGGDVVTEQEIEEIVRQIRDGQSVVTIKSRELFECIADDPRAREQVEYLCFAYSDLTEPAYEKINAFQNLRTLVFYECRGVAHVVLGARRLPNLKKLSFERSPVTAEVIRFISQMQGLEELRFDDDLSWQEIAQLRAIMPETTIERAGEPGDDVNNGRLERDATVGRDSSISD